MFKSKNVDITGGPIVKSVLIYAIPLIIGSLIQVLFNAADLMVLGQMTEDETVTALYNTLVSAMQAFGYSFIPMMNSIVTVLLFRIVWMNFIYPVLDANNRSIHNLYVCFTISWVLCLIAHSITFFIIYAKYKKGRVKAV